MSGNLATHRINRHASRKTITRMQSGIHHKTGRIRAEYTSEGKISLVIFLVYFLLRE